MNSLNFSKKKVAIPFAIVIILAGLIAFFFIQNNHLLVGLKKVLIVVVSGSRVVRGMAAYLVFLILRIATEFRTAVIVTKLIQIHV